MNIDRSSGNIAIESFILGNEANKWEHKFIDNEAVPACDLERKLILSPMFGTIINEHDDMMVRGKNEHEAGHARLTPQNKDPKWSTLKGYVFNSLEDLRIEKVISGLATVIEKDLRGLNQELIRSLGLKLSQNNYLKPVDEALLIMQIREQGLPVIWNVSESAQKYVDAAYPEYMKWKEINNLDNKAGFYELEKVVDKVIEKLEESAEQQNEEEQNQNEENSENNESSNDEEQNNNENSENNENSGNSSNDENSDEEQNKGQKGASDNDNKEDEEDNPEENEDNQSGSSDEENDDVNEEDNEEGSSDGNNSEEDNEEDNEGEENNESSDEGNENRNNEKPMTDIDGGEDSEEGFKKTDKQKKEEARERLEEEFSGDNSLEEELAKKLEKIMEDSKNISSGYTSFTGNDKVVRSPENKNGYEDARKKISSVVGQLSNYTEDAIKALSRVQYQRNLEHGKIDRRKLASLSKSLTKKVFYKTKPGIDLNTAVTIMIDESGSIGSMCYQLRSLAIAFSEVFSKLNINFEVLGFTTDCYAAKFDAPAGVTRTVPMKIIEHKTFGETYQQAKYRLGSINSEECNIDGESILFAYKRIAKEKVNRRIIFVLSDGMPNQGWNGRNISKHLSDTVKFVRENGTEIYGFGIGTNAPERFYGKENFLYLKDISELGTAFFRRFKEIVAR